MNVYTVSSLFLLIVSFNGFADSKENDGLSPGKGKQPRCEVYKGTLCAKYIKNVTIFLKPTQTQSQTEQKLRVAFGYFPRFLSQQCTRYAYPALCLYAFPPCDPTANYPKRRQFCQNECEALQQHICEHEFNYGRGYMANLVPSCSKMPSSDSPEHKKCIRLNVKIDKPVFKLQLKNVTAYIGDTVVLKCKVKSSKIVPRITWYKDDKVIQPGHPSYKIHLFRHRSRMKIRHVKLEDDGKYKCEVTNVAWTVSSENWITINMTGLERNATTEGCRVPQPSSICAPYLTNKTVYFKNMQKEYKAEHVIRRSMKMFHGSSVCSDFALAAMCSHFFPSCVGGVMKHRLCKEDCLKVKNHFCQKMVPTSFPQCSKLPKTHVNNGDDCQSFKYADKPVFRLRLKNITANIGETVVLKCKVKSSKVDPKITWYKDNKVIESDHSFYKIHLFRYSSRIEIKKLHLEDNGKYKCEVTNIGWTISTESWITVNVTGLSKNITFPRCGVLQPNSVCAPYLKGQSVYFENAQKEHISEQFIRRSMKTFHGSSLCSKFVLSAMCYGYFPSCVRGIKKHRLCKSDCLKVRNKCCRNVVPMGYPQCSKLPKMFRREGQYCTIFEYETENKFKRCGVYKGNQFCSKYVANKTIYFYDIQRQYEMERKLSFYLSKSIVSQTCLKFGVPAMCYHLFPVCDQGVKKSRLCKDECLKLKTEVCNTEVALIKGISSAHLKTMFPDCTHLPRAGHEAGKFCENLNIEAVSTSLATDLLYDSTHDCYNKSGVNYLGTYNTSYRGKDCISWNVPRPKSPWSHNYCRNPNKEGVKPWCYVDKGKKEYCAVKKCELVVIAVERSGGESTSLGRTIYVVIAIVAVILLGCVTVVVYWKVQNSKENPDVSPAGSAMPFAKSGSIQLSDTKENTAEIKSFVMKEIMTRGKVKCISRMWEGQFCKVFKGELVTDEGNSNMNIVIKALSKDASDLEEEIFKEETNLLCHLQHVNILGLLGISPNQDFVVFEYLSETNLHQYLLQKSPEKNDADTLGVEVLLRIATQIANGMKYLAEFNYVHGDLAARNCFVSQDSLSVKISMLGMASYTYPADYESLGDRSGIFPIRWMSPESLESLTITSENDVWAFGVTLWEMFSFGLRPYSHCTNTEVMKKIAAHELLPCSPGWPSFVRHLTNECWSSLPSARPNFDRIYNSLNNEHMILEDDTIEVRL